MKKNLFFAALAAVALSAGLTSCSNDDDVNADNSFKETYTACYEFNGATDAESEAIMKAYNSAFGVAADVTDPKITITGKDSADCMQKFVKLMEQPAQTVDAMNIDAANDNTIQVFNSNSYSVYVKHFGAQENGDIKKVQIKFGHKNSKKYVESFFMAKNIWTNLSEKDFFKKSPAEFASCNTNTGAKPLSYSSRIGGYTTDVRDNAVTDVVIRLIDKNKVEIESSLTYEDRTYQLAYEYDLDKSTFQTSWTPNINGTILNDDALLVYYTTEKNPNGKTHRLLCDPLAICYQYESNWFLGDKYYDSSVTDYPLYQEYTNQGYDVEFAPMVEYKLVQNTSYKKCTKIQDAANLNQGASKTPNLKFFCVYEKE